MKRLQCLWVVLLWLVCAVFNFGALFAYHQSEHPHSTKEYKATDRELAVTFTYLGPLGTPAVILITNFLEHGWRLR